MINGRVTKVYHQLLTLKLDDPISETGLLGRSVHYNYLRSNYIPARSVGCAILRQITSPSWSSWKLKKEERIEAALRDCRGEHKLSARTAAEFRIPLIHGGSRRFTGARKIVAAEQQLLTPVEEETIIKWAILYYKWGLPIGIRHVWHQSHSLSHRLRLPVTSSHGLWPLLPLPDRPIRKPWEYSKFCVENSHRQLI